jgi:hypothetical protein
VHHCELKWGFRTPLPPWCRCSQGSQRRQTGRRPERRA